MKKTSILIASLIGLTTLNSAAYAGNDALKKIVKSTNSSVTVANISAKRASRYADPTFNSSATDKTGGSRAGASSSPFKLNSKGEPLGATLNARFQGETDTQFEERSLLKRNETKEIKQKEVEASKS